MLQYNWLKHKKTLSVLHQRRPTTTSSRWSYCLYCSWVCQLSQLKTFRKRISIKEYLDLGGDNCDFFIFTLGADVNWRSLRSTCIWGSAVRSSSVSVTLLFKGHWRCAGHPTHWCLQPPSSSQSLHPCSDIVLRCFRTVDCPIRGLSGRPAGSGNICGPAPQRWNWLLTKARNSRVCLWFSHRLKILLSQLWRQCRRSSTGYVSRHCLVRDTLVVWDDVSLLLFCGLNVLNVSCLGQ